MKTFFTILIIISLPSLFSAQIKIHKKLTTQNGLINNQVVSIFQDSKGYMWFGTYGGVSKWDGINLKNFTKADGLASVPVVNINEGKDGTMYFSTYGGGITIFNPNGTIDTLNDSKGLQQNFIMSMKIFKDGNLYLGNGNTVTVWDSLKLLENFAEKYNFKDLRVGSVFEILERKENEFWLATGKKGILVLDKNGYRNYNTNNGLNSNLVTDIDTLSDGTLVISTDKGVNFLENGNITSLQYNNKQFDIITNATYVSQEDIVYSSTGNGLLIYDKNFAKYLHKENGLVYDVLNCISVDNNNTLYVGSNGYGISIFKPGKLENYNSTTGLTNENITAIFQSNNGRIIFGTETGLLISQNIYELKFELYLKGNHITSINEIDKNTLLVGTTNGLKILQGNKVTAINKSNGLPDSNVTSIIKGNDDKFYVGTWGGISIIKNGKVEEVLERNSRKGIRPYNKYQFIQAILLLKDNTLVAGYHGSGISFFKDNEIKNLKIENGLSDGIVNCLFEDHNGKILIGTEQGGLNIYADEKIEIINTKNGLTSNRIKSISEDNSGNIYLGTDNGLNILTFYAGKPFIRTILIDDGLVGNDCNHNSILKDKEGNIWIGTTLGVSKYNPQIDKPNTTGPKTHITGFEIFNVPQNLENFKKNPELNYDENYLKFIFTGINLSAPKKIKYSYHLSGVDKDWVLSENNFVQYTHLDKGNYTFQVKARNEWGYWSEPVSLAFTILPAWWETWWFRLLVISILAGILWTAFQYRLNYLLKLERLRTKIASDLHDDVGSLLTQISMNVDLLGYQKDTNTLKEKSSFIRSKCNDVIGIMSDIVWSIDSRNDNLESFTDRVFNFASNFVKDKNIELKFVNKIEKKQIPLKIDVRQNLMMIAKEAINNAVKYSDCSELEIKFDDINNKFLMQISDNGKGFDFDSVKKGNGLNNMKMRAEAIKANIEFINQNGFTVKITI